MDLRPAGPKLHRTLECLSSQNISIDPCQEFVAARHNARSAMINPVNVAERVVIGESPFGPDWREQEFNAARSCGELSEMIAEAA
jgi:hypothetical protein